MASNVLPCTYFIVSQLLSIVNVKCLSFYFC